MTPQLATKAEFAAIINVSPGRVSQYIAEGKLGPDELEGTGRAAKVRVPRALEKLRLRLDPSQMLGNGLGTKLSSAPAPRPAADKPEDTLDLQLKQAKLAQALAANAKAEEEARARAGIYVRADDTKAEMSRLTGDLLQAFEGGLADIATAIAGQYQLPQRDVVHLVRTMFRETRAKIAERLRIDARSVPAQVEDVVTRGPEVS